MEPAELLTEPPKSPEKEEVSANKWANTVALIKKQTKGFGALGKKAAGNDGGDDEDADAEPKILYLTPNAKFDLLNDYFGISSLPLPPCGGNERLMKKAIKRLKKEGAVISGDYDKLWHVIQTLKNQNENKKNTKDAE